MTAERSNLDVIYPKEGGFDAPLGEALRIVKLAPTVAQSTHRNVVIQ